MTAAAIIGPKFYGFDNNGNRLANGKVFAYEPGTTTPKATYTDETATTANAHPVVLNAAGFASIYLVGTYKIVVKDANDVEIWTADPVTDATQLATEWVKSTPATQASPTTFTVDGNQTEVFVEGRRVRLKDSAVLYGYVSSASYVSPTTTVTVVTDDGGALTASLSEVRVSNDTPLSAVNYLTTASGSQPIKDALNQRVIYVDTIADLQALPVGGLVDGQQVQVKEYNAGTGVGGGEFYWDAASTEMDNGGIIFGSGTSGRWKRMVTGEVATPHWYGLPLTSNDVDYTAEIQSVISFPRFEFPQGFESSVSTLYPVSNTRGNFRDAKLTLLSGTDYGISVVSFTNDGAGNIPRDIEYKGGIIDGNRGAESGSGPTGGNFSMHGCELASGINCKWDTVEFNNCVTDGVFAFESTGETIKNFNFFRVSCDNNGRQGLTVAAAEDLHFWGAKFTNTNGQSPECGIDLEPGATSKTVNVFFHDETLLEGNAGRGMKTSFKTNEDTVVFDRLIVKNNRQDEPAVNISGGDGIINFKVGYVETDTDFRLEGASVLNLDIGRAFIGGSFCTNSDQVGLFIDLNADYINCGRNDYSSFRYETSPFAFLTDKCRVNVRQLVAKNLSTDTGEGYGIVISGGNISIDNAVSSAAKPLSLYNSLTGGTGVNLTIEGDTLAEGIRVQGSNWKFRARKESLDGQTFALLIGDNNRAELEWNSANALACDTSGALNSFITVIARSATSTLINFNGNSNDNFVSASYLDTSATPVTDTGTGNIVAGSRPLLVNS